MKKLKNILLMFILLLTCSFTIPKPKNITTYTVTPFLKNDNVVIKYDNNEINLSYFRYYHLTDGKFTNKIVSIDKVNPFNVLDITINFLGQKNNLEINLLKSDNVITLNGFISDDYINKLNITIIHDDNELFEKHVDNTYLSNYHKTEKTKQNYKLVRNDYNDYYGNQSIKDISSLQYEFKEKDFSNGKIDAILNSFESGINNGKIGISNLAYFIGIDSLLQNDTFFLVNDDVIVFIDSKERKFGEHINYICIIKAKVTNTTYRKEIEIIPHSQFYMIAADRNRLGDKQWKNGNYDEGLRKAAYINSVSAIYSIVDINFKTSVEHTSNIYDDSYDPYKDPGAFISQYEKDYEFSKMRNKDFDKLVENIINLGLSNIKYIGDILNVTSIFKLYEINEIEKELKETTGSFSLYFNAERKKNIENNDGKLLRYINDYILVEDENENGRFLDTKIMKFNENDHLKLGINYGYSNINTQMRFQTLVNISLRHTYANPTINYSNKKHIISLTEDYNRGIGGENNV